MSRILVFCGDRTAIERFDMLPDWQVIVGRYTAAQKARILLNFRANRNAKLAVDRSMITGWRAPADTIVLFDPSWKHPHGSPEWHQATMRIDQLVADT